MSAPCPDGVSRARDLLARKVVRTTLAPRRLIEHDDDGGDEEGRRSRSPPDALIGCYPDALGACARSVRRARRRSASTTTSKTRKVSDSGPSYNAALSNVDSTPR